MSKRSSEPSQMNERDISATERALIGAILSRPCVVDDVVAILGARVEVMAESSTRAVWGAILALYGRGKTCDPVSVTDLVPDQTLTIGEMLVEAPLSCYATQYAELVRDAVVRRDLREGAREVAMMAGDRDTETDEVIARADSMAFAAARSMYTGEVVSIGDLVGPTMTHIERLVSGESMPNGITAGVEALDRLTGGWQKTDLVILAARPSVGKTAFGLANALVASKRGVPVFYISLEMARAQLTQRMLGSFAGIASGKLRTGALGKNEAATLRRGADSLGRLPITIDDAGYQTVPGLRSKIRRFTAEHGSGLVIVDYLQLITPPGLGGREQRYVQVGEISHALKALAKEIDSPIIALSQLARSAESEADGFRKMAHLRESGAIEQDADLVLILSHPSKDVADGIEANGHDPSNVLDCTLAKHRNGATGRFFLYYDKATQRFSRFAADSSDSSDLDRTSPSPSISDPEPDDDDIPF